MRNKTIKTVALAVAALLTLAACGTARPAIHQTVPATPGAPASAHVAQIGDTLSVSTPDQRLSVTLVAVRDRAGPRGEFDAPEAGNRLVAVQVRVTNDGPAAYEEAITNCMRLIDGQDQQYDVGLRTSNAGVAMPSVVRLPPGGAALGWVTFEVPLTAVPARVQFAPLSGTGVDAAQWVTGMTGK